MNINRYVREGGVRCPQCNSLRIEGDDITMDNGEVWQDIRCLACGLEWIDRYRLVGILLADGTELETVLLDEDELDDEFPDEDTLDDYDLMNDTERQAVLRNLFGGVA